MARIEMRRHFRKSMHADAWIADMHEEVWRRVQFLDISRSGVALISAEAQIVDSTRMIRFNLPNSRKRIEATGKIVHNTEHAFLPGYRVGIQFVGIDAEDVGLIDQFIAKSDDQVSSENSLNVP